jgi:hypothetical protein
MASCNQQRFTVVSFTRTRRTLSDRVTLSWMMCIIIKENENYLHFHLVVGRFIDMKPIYVLRTDKKWIGAIRKRQLNFISFVRNETSPAAFW